MMYKIDKANTRIVARCFFCASTGNVEYENYDKRYSNVKDDEQEKNP